MMWLGVLSVEPRVGESTMRYCRMLLLLAAAFGLSVEAARAQVYRPYVPPRRPPVSPYLDLLRGPGPTFNYYRRIRPELEMRRQLQLNQLRLQNLQTRVDLQAERLNRLLGGSTRFGTITLPIPYGGAGAGQAAAGLTLGGMPPTGHPTAFGDLGGYFPGLGGSSGGLSVTVGTRAPQPILPRPSRPAPPSPTSSVITR